MFMGAMSRAIIASQPRRSDKGTELLSSNGLGFRAYLGLNCQKNAEYSIYLYPRARAFCLITWCAEPKMS